MSSKKLEVVNKTNGRSNLLSITTLQTEIICNLILQLSQTQVLLHIFNQDETDVEAEFLLNVDEEETISGYEIDVNGLMVPAVVVPKEKARVAFETEVREKSSGPSIVEHVAGNMFKIRIYPIKARSKRIVKITFVRSLENNEFKLDLESPQNQVSNMSCKVIAIAPLAGENPRITSSSFGSTFQFATKPGTKDNKRFEALYESASYSGQGNSLLSLRCSFAKLQESCTIVEMDTQQLQYFCINDIQSNYSMKSDLSMADVKTIGLFWDCSLSRMDSDKTNQLQVLKLLLERLKEVTVELSVFSNEVHLTKSFKIANGRSDDLLQTIKSVDYDGATNLGCLEFKQAGFHLLFSDGITTLGSEPSSLQSPVYCFASEDQFDHNMLKTIAFQSGGEFFNLKKISSSEIPNMVISRIVSSPFSFISSSSDPFVYDVFPCVPTPIQNDKFFICGKIRSTASGPIKLTLNFGYGSKITQQKSFVLTPLNTNSEEDVETEVEADSNGLLPRYWAQKKINHLILYPETDLIIKQIEDVGKQYNIVTKTTSFIVLETLDQYLKYCIEPPFSLPDVRKEYFLRINHKKAQDKEKFDQKLGNTFDLWSRRVTWWDTEYLQKTWQPVILHFKNPTAESQFEKSIERWYRQTEFEKYEQIRTDLEHKEAELKSKNASMEANREVLVQSLQSNITQWTWQTNSSVVLDDGKLILKVNLAPEADLSVVANTVKEFLSDRLPSRFYPVISNLDLVVLEEDKPADTTPRRECPLKMNPFSEYGLESGTIVLVKPKLEIKFATSSSTTPRTTRQEKELTEEEKIQAFVDISHETQKLMDMNEEEMRRAVEMDSMQHMKDETSDLDYMVEREIVFGLDSIKDAVKDIKNMTQLPYNEKLIGFLGGVEAVLVAFQTEVVAKQPDLFKSNADWSKGLASSASGLTKAIRSMPDNVREIEYVLQSVKSITSPVAALISGAKAQNLDATIIQKMTAGVKAMGDSIQNIQTQMLARVKELSAQRTSVHFAREIEEERQEMKQQVQTRTTGLSAPSLSSSPGGMKLFGKAKPAPAKESAPAAPSAPADLDDIMECINDSNEISEAMSAPISDDIDEDELLMELEQMEEEVPLAMSLPKAPVSNTTFSSKIAEWDEAAELLELERSMGETETEAIRYEPVASSISRRESQSKVATVSNIKATASPLGGRYQEEDKKKEDKRRDVVDGKPKPVVPQSSPVRPAAPQAPSAPYPPMGYPAAPPAAYPAAPSASGYAAAPPPRAASPAMQPAQPLSAASQRLNTASNRLVNARRIAKETEEIGNQAILSLEAQQQRIMREQDEDLDRLSASVGHLKNISRDISTEVEEHSRLLDDMDSAADFSQQRAPKMSFFSAMKQIPSMLSQMKPGQDAVRLRKSVVPMEDKPMMRKVTSEIDDVKDIMRNNIDSILNRGESLEMLMEKSQELEMTSRQFIKASARLKRTMWWKNCRLFSAVIGGVLFLVMGFYFFGWSFLVILLCIAVGGAAALRAVIWMDNNVSGHLSVAVQYCTVCGQSFTYGHACPVITRQNNSTQAIQYVSQQLVVQRENNPDQLGNQMNYYWRLKAQKKLKQIADSEIDLSDITLDKTDASVMGFYAGTTYSLNHHTDLQVKFHKNRVASNLPPTQQYRQYLQKRTKGSHPALFVSVADSIFEADRNLAWRVLSNIVELELDNQQHCRLVGYKLEEYGFYDESGLVFQRLLKIRGEEPQSYRDCALSLVRQQKYQQAVNHLVTVIEKVWDVRFEQIETVAFMDLFGVINQMRLKGIEPDLPDHIKMQLDRPMDVDIRVVLTWDTDLTNLELRVVEPSPHGEECCAFHNHTKIGGTVSRDFTGGYGPQEYVLRKAVPGDYQIQVEMYSPLPAWMQEGGITACVKIYTNWGRASQQEKITTVTMTAPRQRITVATITCA